MAKKPTSTDRKDPKKNKSLAVRIMLGKMQNAKAAEVAAAVKKEFGHTVPLNVIYMVKTKTNMAADGRPKKKSAKKSDSPMNSATTWVGAIRIARDLLKATGSVANATALLKAVDG